MGRVFVTRLVPGRALDLLRAAGHEVDLWSGELPPPPAVLRERVEAADAVLALLTDRIDGDFLAGCSRLRVVANMAVGYDNIDPAVAAEAGVWVTNTPGVLAETTADFAFALLLDVARHVTAAARAAREGRWKTWSPTGFLGPDVHGATLGIVGLGEIGRAMARRAQGFSMRVLYAGRPSRVTEDEPPGVFRVELDQLLGASDFVSLHVPLTGETRHLVGARELALMRQAGILVNTSRGGVVDQAALVDALAAGRVGGAGLDVADP